VELRRPLCGNTDAHEPHGFWAHGYTVWNECPGWSVTEADTTALVQAVRAFRAEHWPLPDPRGTGLECHPSVWHYLLNLMIPGYTEFVSGNAEPEPLPGIPVTASVAMERGEWKLASDFGVIAEGKIRERDEVIAHG
jgi:hypothetical protein